MTAVDALAAEEAAAAAGDAATAVTFASHDAVWNPSTKVTYDDDAATTTAAATATAAAAAAAAAAADNLAFKAAMAAKQQDSERAAAAAAAAAATATYSVEDLQNMFGSGPTVETVDRVAHGNEPDAATLRAMRRARAPRGMPC
jgi:hypothetical protein